MKLYLKIGLALAIVFVFLMTSKLLTSEAASDGANPRPRITAESTGVRANARITTPGEGTDKEEIEVGDIDVNFPPAGSATTQFNNASHDLRGTQLLGTGPGTGAVSITQTGPQAFRAESNSTVNNINLFDGAVTADRSETRLICELVSEKVTCPVQSVVFRNLKVNGAPQPNRPEPNTKIEFTRQVTVGDASFLAKFVVTLSPSSFTTKGKKIEARLGEFDVVVTSIHNAQEHASLFSFYLGQDQVIFVEPPAH